jgi:hypothetical protein
MDMGEEGDPSWRGRPVVLCRLQEAEAALMAGRLRAEGIPASVDPVDLRIFGAYRGGPSLNEVFVPEDRLDEAREIARRILRLRGSSDG